MRKKFIILLILIFVLGLAPINFSQAITQNQISAEVQIVCPDNYGNWFSGSGTIIDPKGIILTNKHVVTDEKGGIIKACFIGFTESINQAPNFGTQTNPNLAEVKYYTSTNDMDTAILYLSNTANKTYAYVDIWNSNSNTLQFGNKIEAIGFPSIGGSTITYTSGDFSGFGSATDGTQNYIKATTPLEHGNSGGAAYNPAGQFIGIPTMVVAGTLNSLSYILSVNSIKNWLAGILGMNYQQEIIEQKPIIKTPNVNIQDDITPPQLKGFNIEYQIINDHDSKKSYIQYSIPWNAIIENGTVEKIYYYFGNNEFADPLSIGKSFKPSLSENIEIPEKFLLTDENELYFIIKLQDSSGNISNPVVAPWQVSYMKQVGVESSIYNDALIRFKKTDNNILSKYTGRFIKNNDTIWWVSPRDNVRFLVYSPILGLTYLRETIDTWLGSQWNGFSVSTGVKDADLSKKPKNIWGHMLLAFKNDMSGVSDGQCGWGCYINPDNGNLIYLGSMVSWEKDGKEAYDIITGIAKNISYNEINLIEPLGKNNYVWQHIQYETQNNHVPLYISGTVQGQPQPKTQQESSDLSNRLKGKILLQVEAHGEAYYVYPQDGKRYYMANGNEAYRIMRYLGVGITNNDLDKIKNDKNFAKKHSGKIFLQVEAHGEAFYIDFEGNNHYLKDGGVAYNIMRELGLGITNSDLSKISEGNL